GSAADLQQRASWSTRVVDLRRGHCIGADFCGGGALLLCGCNVGTPSTCSVGKPQLCTAGARSTKSCWNADNHTALAVDLLAC
ncbi:unnamed protein product, partial [Closterium sp. NIES-54]